jgi:putative transposase
MGELKSRAHSFGQNCYHFIWGPRCRHHLLKPVDINKVCYGVLRMIAFQNKYVIKEMRVMEDHIHCFVEIPPSVSVSEAFNKLKGISSRVLRRNFPWLRRFKSLWSKGKFYRSVGNVTGDVVEHYITHSQGNWNYFNVARKYRLETQSRLATF